MSRYLLAPDLHAQSKPAWKLPYYRTLFREISDIARAKGCDAVIVPGDVWDQKHGVNVEVLQMLFVEFSRSAERGVPWILLRGNHEISEKSNPHSSLLTLFGNTASVYLRPKILRGEGFSLYLLPWYLADHYKQYSKHLAQRASLDQARHKILISHVGLNEGQLSPSNCYRVSQKVSLTDLHPKCYNLIFLGDYHMTQTLSDRCMYGGSPIAHMFGDAHGQGVWFLDLSSQELRLENIKLSSSYPEYKTLRLKEGAGIPELDFTGHSRYKLVVHSNDAHKVRDYLGNDRVNIETYGDRTVDESDRRLQNISTDDPIAVFAAFLEKREIEDRMYLDLGNHALKRAMGELYGKA